MKPGYYIVLILATLGFGCVWFLLGFGVLMLVGWFSDWMSAIGKDEHEEVFNMGLPAKKSQK